MIKIVSACLIFVFSILYALQIDDPIDSETQKLIDKIQPPKTSSAYFYLLGFLAAENDEPIEIGKNIYRKTQQNEKQHADNTTPSDHNNSTDQLNLPSIDDVLFCKTWKPGCIEALFDNNQDLENTIKSNTLLATRYKQFVRLSDFATLTSPSLSESLPSYVGITNGNKLLILTAINETKNNNIGHAKTLLFDNISKLRKQLAIADTLVGKIVFLMLIAENIDVLSVISQKHGRNTLVKLVSLTDSEKSFELPMARELTMLYNMNKNLDGSPQFWDKDGNVPSWLVKLVFKPNMSTNRISPIYKRAIDNSLLSHSKFADRILENKELSLSHSWVRNYAGTTLNAIALPDYNKYIARIIDLETKIILFNATNKLSSMEVVINTVSNPYYTDKRSAYLSKDSKSICFDGPLADDNNLRCLRIKL